MEYHATIKNMILKKKKNCMFYVLIWKIFQKLKWKKQGTEQYI